jgi:phosphoribosyl-dephospho-CoA transferase
MGRAVNPHDLLRLADNAPPFADAPAWVMTALARAPFVVVRRAPRRGPAIAVGVRGAARSERFAAWLDERDVAQVVSPEDLSARAPRPERVSLPAFALLGAAAPLLDASGHPWGPTGSVAFELATGTDTVSPSSDLDLVLRAPEPMPQDRAATLFDALTRVAREAGARVDVQVQTRNGGFALAEFAHANPRVMLRTDEGPRLVTNPWDTERAR